MNNTITIEPSVAEVSRTRGQQWVRPPAHWTGSDGSGVEPDSGAVAVETNTGWLVLADVIEVVSGPRAGTVRYVLVKADSLPRLGE